MGDAAGTPVVDRNPELVDSREANLRAQLAQCERTLIHLLAAYRKLEESARTFEHAAGSRLVALEAETHRRAATEARLREADRSLREAAASELLARKELLELKKGGLLHSVISRIRKLKAQ